MRVWYEFKYMDDDYCQCDRKVVTISKTRENSWKVVNDLENGKILLMRVQIYMDDDYCQCDRKVVNDLENKRKFLKSSKQSQKQEKILKK